MPQAINLGGKVEDACLQARQGVLFVSPFIKRGALRRLTDMVPKNVPLTVIVRFLPIDIASGVTDPEIVADLLARANTRVLAQPSLHAKIYRIDGRLFVGSANLTNKALGWSQAANIEILIEVDGAHDEVLATIEVLNKTAYELTPERVAETLERLPKVEVLSPSDAAAEKPWIPACRRPEILWDIYSKGNANAILSVIEGGKYDLNCLQIEALLPKVAFEAMVRANFLSSLFYKLLISRISVDQNGLNDTNAPQWIVETFGEDLRDEPLDIWANTKAWLREFCSDALHFSPQVEKVTVAQPLR